MSLKAQINKNNIPKHVAIIMDGNGRWAAQRGNQRIFGHENGVESVRAAIEAAGELGVEYITLYAFSTENWNRPKQEVDALMSLLVSVISHETENLNENNVKLATIGDRSSLPADVNENLDESIQFLAQNTGLTVVLALSYSARWEILNAVKNIAQKVKDDELALEDITAETFNQSLTTCNMPDPELLIRTSGENRISNFLLWQIAYAELYFTPKLWPDFRKDDFYKAIIDFQGRERRFGKTSAQIKK